MFPFTGTLAFVPQSTGLHCGMTSDHSPDVPFRWHCKVTLWDNMYPESQPNSALVPNDQLPDTPGVITNHQLLLMFVIVSHTGNKMCFYINSVTNDYH